MPSSRFSETRALAFSEYTLTALIEELAGRRKRNAGAYILRVPKAGLAQVLGLTNSRRRHLDFVADVAARESVGMFLIGKWVYFVREGDADEHAEDLDVKDATAVTDEFERVYGSKAADAMWENETYR